MGVLELVCPFSAMMLIIILLAAAVIDLSENRHPDDY